MGSLCCCACIDEFEDYTHPSNLIYRHCTCLRFLFHQLLSGYGAMFHRLEGRSVQSGVTSLASSRIATALPDSSLNETQLSVSRPISYDASDQRYSRLQRDGLVSRREKSMAHFQDDTQPLRRNVSSSGAESLGFGKKPDVVDFKEDSKLVHSESSERVSPAMKMAYGVYNVQTSTEDEDVCPTCLDEYTPENPKITTQCSHHFHLGCIYEWLERSESCPICGKEMAFCESP